MSRQFKPVAVMRLPWGEDLEMVSGSLGTTAATLATGRDVFLSAKGDHPWSHPLYRIIHEYEFMWVAREIEFLPQADLAPNVPSFIIRVRSPYAPGWGGLQRPWG